MSLLLLLGCPPGAEDSGCGEVAVEVGNGDAAHVPAGAGVVMVHGPQGGWHVWVSAGTKGFGEVVSLRATIDDLTVGERVSDGTYEMALRGDLCAGSVWGLLGLLPGDDPTTAEVETPPAWRACHTFEICVSVEDEDAHGSSCVTATAWVDPIDRADAEDPCSYAGAVSSTP